MLSTAEIGNFYYGPGHPMKPHREIAPILSILCLILSPTRCPLPENVLDLHAQTALKYSVQNSGENLGQYLTRVDISAAFAFPSLVPSRLLYTGIRMCHNLILNYRLYEKMDVFVRSPPLPRISP